MIDPRNGDRPDQGAGAGQPIRTASSMQHTTTLNGDVRGPLTTWTRTTGTGRLGLPWGVAGAMLLVCAGYYVGSQIGFILRLPPSTPSVLWPPNAILTATLLLAPPRRWALYLLSALPAHLVAQMDATWPMTMSLLLFFTNCSEALLGAIVVRSLSDAPARFDTLRRALAFVVGAVVLGPFLSSFLDAGVVAALGAEAYWNVWAVRFPSNVLTELALVPAIVTVVRHRTTWIRAASPRRRWEAALLGVALFALVLTVFSMPTALQGAMFTSHPTPLTFLLPLFIWAAVRFGPGGASLTLLATALVAVSAGTRGLGLFGSLPATERVLALQVFLTATATPLLCLAALIEERRNTQEALGERLRFEELLSRLSGAFVQPPSHEMHGAFRTWLARLGEFLRVDGVLLLEPPAGREGLATVYSWTAPGWSAGTAGLPAEEFPWLTRRLREGQSCLFSRPSDLDAEASYDRASFEGSSVRAALGLPLLAGGRVLGALAFLARRERTWEPELLPQLRVVTEVLANALARRQSEDALRASEAMKGAILSSLSSYVAVLDRGGRVIALNDSWALALRQHSGEGDQAPAVTSYLELCRRSNQPATPEDVTGIADVLEGSLPAFAAERGERTAEGERWHAISVVPLNRPEGGAVVSHTDITGRRHAEMEARQSREELAHFLRVSTVGELTTSLAHELNQPLTAILANAQAARHLLSTARPDLDEVQQILADMIDEDKRAGEVIRRLRELLKKGQREAVLLDVNVLVEGVAQMMGNDAIIRNVAVRLELHPEPLTIRGDRVQIQQVLLNLMLNAMEAMVDSGPERTLVLRSGCTPGMAAQVDVQDTGKGLLEGLQELVFQPFYTTKPTGMGMGLSIARSIVDAHGGSIRATRNPEGGATFRVTLPLVAA
jgi:signal transduction histidine kinase/integral membrane sensor domain MASE1